MTLADYFTLGGPVMYLILLTSIIWLTFFIERFIYLRNVLAGGREIMGKLREKSENLKIDEGLAQCDNNPGPLSNIIRAGLVISDRSGEEIEITMEAAAKLELPGLNRFISVLASVPGISTLLGLLGSVLGMIHSGAILSAEGAVTFSGIFSIIAKALITTAFGLCVAIPALASYNYITAKVNFIISEIEIWTAELIKILKRRPEKPKW
jgi:biopolymer transport protein ExbB